ncbi:AAEL011834-PA [Aedes aegypti]|uniref:AAEL011834-PA n=1 Tax=Aedes aegypti TaxID=7159 RepID=Q16NX5_AEDAE|nr:AAEL011834-PA [Aedes aegypti]
MQTIYRLSSKSLISTIVDCRSIQYGPHHSHAVPRARLPPFAPSAHRTGLGKPEINSRRELCRTSVDPSKHVNIFLIAHEQQEIKALIQYPIQQLSKDVSLLLSAVHGKIKALKSNSRGKNHLEIVLQQNMEKKLLISLKCATVRVQQNQARFNDNQNNMKHNTELVFGDLPVLNSVDTFDNFLNMNVTTSSKSIPDDNEAETLDEYFQLPATGLNVNQKQLMIIEADNSKMIRTREYEVSRIVDSIDNLNVVFKDLAHIVMEQGTILDRIDYNIECTQTKIFEGYEQLKIAEIYQRKNKRIYCICVLASMIMFMIILTMFTKL